MKVSGFCKAEVMNPNNGEVSTKVRVKFDNGEIINLFDSERTTDELIAYIRENREDVVKRIAVRDGEFGKFCVISRMKILEEF